jgi:hypothetical protein
MSKKTFTGEGNPSDPVMGVVVPAIDGKTKHTLSTQRIASADADWSVEISNAERDVLKIVLDRDRTSKQVYGGLQGILGISRDEAATLIEFLKRL